MSVASERSSGVSALSSICAMRGWQGRADIDLPCFVMRPFPSMAPRLLNSDSAWMTLALGGGVIQGRFIMSLSPHAAMSRRSGARSQSEISGVLQACILCIVPAVHSL